MPYEKEEDERSEINRDHVCGERVQNILRMVTPYVSLLTRIRTPSPQSGPLPL